MLTFLCMSAKSQVVEEQEVKIEKDSVFYMVEKIPEYPGGDKARNEFLSQNIVYPKYERNNNIQGMVVVGFTIEKDGSLSGFRILKGVTPAIDAEALRVCKMMPNWTPGEQRGKTVRVSINLPIRFALSGGEKSKKKERKAYNKNR